MTDLEKIDKITEEIFKVFERLGNCTLYADMETWVEIQQELKKILRDEI